MTRHLNYEQSIEMFNVLDKRRKEGKEYPDGSLHRCLRRGTI